MASVGSQGNDNISNYLYVDYYSIEPSGEDMSIVFSQKGNELITWETNTNINAGVDFELFRGRLGGTVEYFNRKTSDMLFWFSVLLRWVIRATTPMSATCGTAVSKSTCTEPRSRRRFPVEPHAEHVPLQKQGHQAGFRA